MGLALSLPPSPYLSLAIPTLLCLVSGSGAWLGEKGQAGDCFTSIAGFVVIFPPQSTPTRAGGLSLGKALGETLLQSVLRSYGKCSGVSCAQFGFDRLPLHWTLWAAIFPTCGKSAFSEVEGPHAPAGP